MVTARVFDRWLTVLIGLGTVPFLPACDEVAVNVLPVTDLRISPASVEVIEGATVAIEAVPLGPSGQPLSGRTIGWTSEGPAVASVSNAGVVRGEAPGTTTVRANVDQLVRSIPVTVLTGPTIGIPVVELILGGFAGSTEPIVREIGVVNQGHGELSGLSVEVLEDPGGPGGWLVATLLSGTAPTTLTVQADPSGLPSGVYRGTLTLIASSAHGVPRSIEIHLTVTEPPPTIRVDATQVSFAAPPGAREPATLAVSVDNAGGGVLDQLETEIDYRLGALGWLTVELEDTTAPTTLELSASALSLLSGTYRARVTVSSAGVAQSASFDVLFQVQGSLAAPAPAR